MRATAASRSKPTTHSRLRRRTHTCRLCRVQSAFHSCVSIPVTLSKRGRHRFVAEEAGTSSCCWSRCVLVRIQLRWRHARRLLDQLVVVVIALSAGAVASPRNDLHERRISADHRVSQLLIGNICRKSLSTVSSVRRSYLSRTLRLPPCHHCSSDALVVDDRRSSAAVTGRWSTRRHYDGEFHRPHRYHSPPTVWFSLWSYVAVTNWRCQCSAV